MVRSLFRLDSIAEDAELQEKSEADLSRLIDTLQSQCEQAMKEYEEKLKEDPMFDGKKSLILVFGESMACNSYHC